MAVRRSPSDAGPRLLLVLERDYLRRGAAEFVGTFALIFVGCAAVAFARSLTDVALAHGLVIAVFVSALGFISGGHFNPAVTLGFLITRRIAPTLAVFYWVIQLGAAVLAALLLNWVLPNAMRDRVQPRLAVARRRDRRRAGRRDRGRADVLPRLRRLRNRGRPARRVRADLGPRDRLHDRPRHLHGRPADGRGDEPGARVRPDARQRHVEQLVGLVHRPAAPVA